MDLDRRGDGVSMRKRIETPASTTGRRRVAVKIDRPVAAPTAPGVPPVPTPAQALYDATVRELLARQQGYLLVRRYLDQAEADCHDAGYALPLAAGMLAGVLRVRTLLQEEMARTVAEARLAERLRADAA